MTVVDVIDDDYLVLYCCFLSRV